jgi:hypothetical protein
LYVHNGSLLLKVKEFDLDSIDLVISENSVEKSKSFQKNELNHHITSQYSFLNFNKVSIAF